LMDRRHHQTYRLEQSGCGSSKEVRCRRRCSAPVCLPERLRR
jgi:hypothetical protein